MGIDVYFPEHISDRLEALRLTNERLLTLAETLGADARDIALVRAAILGTLDDVATSFGLHRQGLDFVAILRGEQLPVLPMVAFEDQLSDAPKTRA